MLIQEGLIQCTARLPRSFSRAARPKRPCHPTPAWYLRSGNRPSLCWLPCPSQLAWRSPPRSMRALCRPGHGVRQPKPQPS